MCDRHSNNLNNLWIGKKNNSFVTVTLLLFVTNLEQKPLTEHGIWEIILVLNNTSTIRTINIEFLPWDTVNILILLQLTNLWKTAICNVGGIKQCPNWFLLRICMPFLHLITSSLVMLIKPAMNCTTITPWKAVTSYSKVFPPRATCDMTS